MTQGALSNRIGLTCSGVYLLLALTGCATVQVVTADRLNKAERVRSLRQRVAALWTGRQTLEKGAYRTVGPVGIVGFRAS
jgi:hypothetical protein